MATVVQRDQHGRRKPHTYNPMRAIRAFTARLRSEDPDVNAAYTKAGEDIKIAHERAEAAGSAAAEMSAASGGRVGTPRSALGNY